MRMRLEQEVVRIFHVPEFDVRSKKKEILGPVPDQHKLDAELVKVQANCKTNQAPSLRPCYEAPLLSRKQEFHLFRQFNYWKYRAKKCLDDRHVFRAEEHLKKARLVRNRIAESNMRLAPGTLHLSAQKEEELTNAYADVLRTVDYFDFRRGVKFSTYCVWALKSSYHRNWRKEVRHEGVYAEFENFEAGDSGFQKECDHNDLRAIVERLLKKVDDRAADVIRQHYGIGCEAMTLEEIGTKLSVTKERVRQIEFRGLQRIKKIDGTLDLMAAGEYHGTDSGI